MTTTLLANSEGWSWPMSGRLIQRVAPPTFLPKTSTAASSSIMAPHAHHANGDRMVASDVRESHAASASPARMKIA